MARSEILLLCVVLAGCAAKPEIVPPVIAPTPVGYTCEQSRQASAEFNALPAGSMLRVYITDYGKERRDLRAALNLPDPTPCPRST